MSEDQVDLDPQQVANGLAKWDQVAATLQSRWDSINGQITGLLTPATFGSDEPGSNFQASFVDEGQAGTLADRGKKTVQQVDETAQKVRKAAEASLAADAQQATEVGGVNVPGFKTGAGSGGGGGSSAGGGSAMMSGGGSSGGSSGMLMAEMAPGSGGASGMVMSDMVMTGASDQFVPDRGMVMSDTVMTDASGQDQFVSDGGMAMGEMVREDSQLGPSDQDVMYERLPIGENQSPYPPPGEETQVPAGSGGGAQYSTDGTTSEMVYDAPRGGGDNPVAAGDAGRARESGTVGADRMTTQPVDGAGSNQPVPGPTAGDRGSDGGGAQPAPVGDRGSDGGGAQPAPASGGPVPDGGVAGTTPDAGPADRGQGQEGGPGRPGPDGPAESFRERIADRIPDSIVERLPDGMAERIYEARGDYAVDVPQTIATQPVETQPVETQTIATQPIETQPVETQGVPSSSSAVPVIGLPVEDYNTSGGELTVERPR